MKKISLGRKTLNFDLRPAGKVSHCKGGGFIHGAKSKDGLNCGGLSSVSLLLSTSGL